MLRFIKHNLESIDGIGLYPMISLIIFFSIFIGMLIYVLVIPKSTIEELGNLPLDKNELNNKDYEQQ
ncbi:MAG: CcoQ/FixQ family Cbb3-type cytochrome c oxidase assembly chaperone [Flavobacteriaceae bacterium]|nr:CcoQ/FixQ family Cbb3-type cytochrome c oxidase assembly chaperone [Flavobacteriaceae bacterium]